MRCQLQNAEWEEGGWERQFSKFKYGGDMRCCLLRGRSRKDAGKVRISYILIERDKGKPDWLDWDTWWAVGGDTEMYVLVPGNR